MPESHRDTHRARRVLASYTPVVGVEVLGPRVSTCTVTTAPCAGFLDDRDRRANAVDPHVREHVSLLHVRRPPHPLTPLQHRNGVTLDAVEQLFESADLLPLDILSVVLDALGAPPETVQESYCDRFATTVVEGTDRECQAFLDWVRAR